MITLGRVGYSEGKRKEERVAIEIYSTDTDSGQISVIRKDGGAHTVLQQVPVGNAPRGSVKFTRDGRGFVSNCSTNTVSEIDALTHREVARITVGSGPRGLGLVPGEHYMLVSNSGSNTVSIVDLESRAELAQVAVGRDPRHMAITKDGKYAYVCVWGSSYISKLDISGLADGNAAAVREVGRIVLGRDAFPYSLNIDRSGARAFVACNGVALVPVIDLSSDTIEKMVEVESSGGRAVAFTPDNEFALVTIERTDSVAVIDMRDLKVTRYIPVGPSPRGIAVDDNDGTIYCALFSRASWTPRPDQKEQPGKRYPTQPHAVTVVHIEGVDLSTVDAEPDFEQIGVGFGPCSVSIFDPDKIAFDTARLNKASAELVQETTTPA
jgi:YVTN family beta-propeller protein